MIENLKDRQSTEVVEEFRPLVEWIARKIASRFRGVACIEDLIQCGFMGLLDAFQKFDPDMRTQFKTYAELRIRGAMLDEVRKLGPNPRSALEFDRKVINLKQAFLLARKRNPTYRELCKSLDIPSDKLDAHLLRFKFEPMPSIDSANLWTPGDRAAYFNAQAEHANRYERKFEALETIKAKLKHLSPLDRGCYFLYHIWGLTLLEVGEVFGWTEAAVCSRLKAVLRRERERGGSG